MASNRKEEGDLSLLEHSQASSARRSHDSLSSVSTTSLVFERINERVMKDNDSNEKRQRHDPLNGTPYADHDDEDALKDEQDLETGPFLAGNDAGEPGAKQFGTRRMDKGLKKIIIIVSSLIVVGWLAGLFVYVSTQAYKHPSQLDHDPEATGIRGTGKQITLDQIQEGFWYPQRHSISWIAGADGEDGLLLERAAADKDYLVVEDVRSQAKPRDAIAAQRSKTLMKKGLFEYNGKEYVPSDAIPSKDLQRVLLMTDRQSNWRHSSTANYWILDVGTQTVDPLVPGEPDARVQLAQWSPTSDQVVYTKDNDIYVRRLGYSTAKRVTTDGGAEVFNGVPDWVYEEEVLASGTATWWSADGNYFAFLRTNETGVPEYPVQYFVSRPSGKQPAPGEEAYPEVRQIKYPKAGSHNPVVDLFFYDVIKGDVFEVEISGGFADDDRLITTVVWAGNKEVLIKETNRVSDVMRVVLVDVASRTGKTVRTMNVKALDGGWFEISQKTKYIPADPRKNRPADGYIDTVIHDNGDHLAYFTPLDNPDPIMLTSGSWEVESAPSAVDLDRNLVYFVGTKESSIQRHVYSVRLDGKDLSPLTDTTVEGYYGASFSAGAGYMLLSYQGPKIPWQKVVSTPSNPSRYEHIIEKNDELADSAKKYELPIEIYGTINVDGVDLNYVERRPPHFDEKKKYPVLFQQYSGPGSQQVDKKFTIDFQSYVAANLGYICVTVDGRGTGFIGRKNRVLVRGNLGRWESHDQIAAAKVWKAKRYVDGSRLAIWGWSYGGFMTLKTLEQDAGETFSYGMAVAPVTDWRFYDSIYTERYMLTPQANAAGYAGSAVSNVSALARNVRFLLMHGVADDNVHMQNSLTLLDKLDLAGVENYDVHVFPDSDHGIYFHNANRIVFDKLNNWLVNAFNGEWLKIADAKPKEWKSDSITRERRSLEVPSRVY
ncbi:Dipeptidyl aminopeptidase-like protein [Coniochaeta hoffmannii]|uniref:Probable dipeptidyl-aminopeptidase B n=1 Tax=Coniochaeta hoffmannii TaxID=91930 RepID=A0AA38VK37_9PEZI|nr:Dipeptidyl aminopeptidase-like protein [Coniochaeta hoffmannii]